MEQPTAHRLADISTLHNPDILTLRRQLHHLATPRPARMMISTSAHALLGEVFLGARNGVG
jgi:hypothetical protein